MIESLAIEKDDISQATFERLRDDGRVAWDIETSGLDWRREQIGTCQLYSSSTGTIIVQVGRKRPELLCALLARQDVLKIFHHAPFDLRFMVSHWKADVRSVVCTKVASKILSPGLPSEDHSLKGLLRTRLGIEIQKDQRLSNWLASDLSFDQISYAANDVVHLLSLYDKLVELLQSADLGQLYQQCCSFLPARVALDLDGRGDVFAY